MGKYRFMIIGITLSAIGLILLPMASGPLKSQEKKKVKAKKVEIKEKQVKIKVDPVVEVKTNQVVEIKLNEVVEFKVDTLHVEAVEWHADSIKHTSAVEFVVQPEVKTILVEAVKWQKDSTQITSAVELEVHPVVKTELVEAVEWHVDSVKVNPVIEFKTDSVVNAKLIEAVEWHADSVTLTPKVKMAVVPHVEISGIENIQETHDFLSPIGEGRITRKYGPFISPVTKKENFHNGIDIGAKKGTPVKAPADGVVVSVERNPDNATGRGKTVTLQHDNGYMTKYAHLDTILVQEGKDVKAGEIIANVGNTGKSTGPHLHFELLKNNKHINPAAHMDMSDFNRKKNN